MLLHQAGEIWHISASPADKGVLATCYNKSEYLWGSGCPRTTCFSESECPRGSGCPRTACSSESACPGGLIVCGGVGVWSLSCALRAVLLHRAAVTLWVDGDWNKRLLQSRAQERKLDPQLCPEH